MPKRKRADDDTPAVNEEPTVGQLTSRVKNKLKRAQVYEKLKKEQKRERKKARVKRQEAAKEAREKGLEPPKVPEQRTIDNTRVKDETVVDPQDEEVAQEVEQDEFAAHFKREREPQVMVTTCYKPSGIMYKFVAELLELLPCACYYKRQGVALKKIVKFASNRGFSDLVVVNEDKKQINGLLIVHLPDGPTAHFKLSSLKLGADIQGHGRATSHRPELVLNNFDTRLGQRVGRMIASLFHQDPNFKGRRVVTFHNQRDFVFVRHHRYIFEEQEKAERVDGETKRRKRVGVRLQELGPRFTLKLLSLQRGTFDSKAGEYEWIHSTSMNRHCRRKFHL